MPITNSILDHEVIGPAILQGRREGRQEGRIEGRIEGRQEGRQEGRLELLQRLLEKRFGPMPAWVEKRLTTLSAAEFDGVAIRVLDAPRLEDLFPGK